MSSAPAVAPVVVRPIGGLGNQLFIYAAGLALSERLGVPLVIDDSGYDEPGSRTYELDTFDSVGTRVTGVWHRPFAFSARGIRKVAKAIDARIPDNAARRYLTEPGFTFDRRFDHLVSGVHLEGYRQSYRYFQGIDATLRRQITTVRTPTPWFLETQLRLESLRPWIGVHVRRGDYLHKGVLSVHGVADRAYYERGLAILTAQLPERPIVVFSDEPAAAASVLEGLALDALFIVPEPSSRSIESLALMSGASALIIANSSFSWWGAWVGASPNRPVIAPRPWFSQPVILEDLLPPEWLTLGRS